MIDANSELREVRFLVFISGQVRNGLPLTVYGDLKQGCMCYTYGQGNMIGR